MSDFIKKNTTVSIDAPDISVSISTDIDVATIDELKDILIKPLLLAMGYQTETVDELFGEEKYISEDSVGIGDMFFFNSPHKTLRTLYEIRYIYDSKEVVLSEVGTEEPYHKSIKAINPHNLSASDIDYVFGGDRSLFTQLKHGEE